MSVVVACGYCWAEAGSAKALVHADDCSRNGRPQPAGDKPCQAATVGFCDCPRCTTEAP